MSKVKPFTPQRVAKLVRNPGDRAKVPTRLLPEKYRKMRELNARLNAAVTPGSSLTNRDLSHMTSDAVAQRYGQRDLAETRALAEQRSLNAANQGWYAEYVKQLQAHAQNFQAQQPIQFAGMPGASPDQQAAITNRVNSWQGQAALVNQANSAQAQNLADVVGPGLKIQAGMAGQRKLKDVLDQQRQTADEKGAFARQFRTQTVQDEAKTALANAIATGKQSVAEYNAKTSRMAANKPSGKLPPVPWYTWKQWNGLSADAKRAAIKDYKRSTGGGKKGSPTVDGQKPATPEQQGTAQSSISTALHYLRIGATTGVLKTGQSRVVQKGKETQQAIPKMDALWVDVAADLQKYGAISPANVRRLHARGISIKKLGHKTITGSKPGKVKW